MLLGTTIANNSPINFAGEAGNLTQNSYAILDATLDTTGNFTTGTLRIPVVDVQDAMGITLYSAVLQLMTGSTDTFELISATELLPATSGRVASVPGFHDNPSYDVATNVVIFPFVVFDTGTDTQRWYAELEFIPPTTPTDPTKPIPPMQFRLIPPTVISPTASIHHLHPTIEIFLELNMENTLAWATVPLQVNRGGRNHTLESIYRDAGIDLAVVQNAPVADNRSITRIGRPYTRAELLQFQQDHMTNPSPPAAVGRWHMHGAFLPSYTSTSLGVMFTHNACRGGCSITVPAGEIRTGFAVFVNTIATMGGGLTVSGGGTIAKIQ